MFRVAPQLRHLSEAELADAFKRGEACFHNGVAVPTVSGYALGVAHVGGQNTTESGGTIISDSWTSTANSDIIVIGHIFNSAGAATDGEVTDSKGNSYTLLGQLLGGASLPGIAIWHSNDTIRGAAHTVSYNPTGTADSKNLAVIEITGQNTTSDFDSTTFATLADASSPFSPWNIACAAAISGNQIAIYAVTVDAGQSATWTDPGGYTPIISQGNGTSYLVSYAGYKINETGTPTVGASRTDTGDLSGRMLIATFKEAGGGGPTAQQLRPDADIDAATWGTAPLWSKIDEASAGNDVISATAS